MDDAERAVLDVVRGLVAELHAYAPPPVGLDSALDRDLGLDSLAVAELLVRLDEALGVGLPTGLLRTAATPRDLVRPVGSAAGRPSPVRLRRATPAGPAGPAESPQEPTTTLAASLDWHAATHPDRLHVRILGDDADVIELTYGTLRTDARAVAGGLLEMGVAPGESVALMLPTSRDYFVTFLGIVLAGAVPVPLYPPTRPAQLEEHLERQSRILDNARAVLLVTLPEARRVSRLLRASVESLRDVSTPDALARDATEAALPVPQPDDIALLQYTSGSTGNPKGVVLTHRHLLANIAAMARAARVTPDDVFVSWLPLYHDMGLIGAWLGSLHIGMPLVSQSPQSFLVRPIRWLQAIDEHRATISAAPNFAYERCLRTIADAELATLDLSRWRLAFNGAEAVNPTTLRRFTERFAPCGLRPESLLPVYGLAEAAVGLAFPPVGRAPVIDRIHRATFIATGCADPIRDGDPSEVAEYVACGQPLPGYELRVVDDGDRELPERREGHLRFRGPSATTGYVRNPAATHALLHGDWLDTGDLGYLADGDLYVTGRVKDVIIRAGRNLHPDELEQVVGRVPGVRRGCVAAFAAADPAAGTERLVVVAETRETDADCLTEIRRRIVAATVDLVGTPPDTVELATPGTVPKTSSGKIRRAETRSRYEHGRLAPQQRALWRQVAHYTWRRLPARWHRLRRAIGDGLHAARCWAVFAAIGLPLVAVLAVLPGRRLRWSTAAAAARAALRLTGTPARIHGEHPPSGAAVIVANHASWLDGIVLTATLPGPMRFVAGEVFAHQALAGLVLRRIGTVFVERWDRQQGVADAAHLADLTRVGDRLAVFSEGGLSPLPGLRPFHLGGFAAAAAGGTPVIPVAVRGTRWILRPGRRVLRRGAIDIVIGAPIHPTGTDWRAAVQLRDTARATILRHCGEPDLA
ncbi:MAG TPA: AMP-binding protein [Acidimicrobiales bacterium]|nr:AMP-binding protein [Acidimicrobiales bacterium]